jgi:excisionase family DNA binding protein
VPDPEEWVTVPRAAELLGLQPHTVYRMIDRGELRVEFHLPPGPKRRRGLRVPVAAVDELLARARVRPGELRHLYEL